MARTRRRINPITGIVPEAPKDRVYRAAGYARLSMEDSGKPGADTIDEQKRLISEFIQTQSDMSFVGLYADNGKTGTNFERPSFERLMDDIRSGKVDCIVVKDLSRFGRNYLETGEYLERVFPFLGVRFVSINDHFDTLTASRNEDGYIVPLKNIINDAYSKDISRKIVPAMAAMQQRGEFIGSWAAYGYRRCADDPHRIEPDEETAPVVRKMFAWRCAGMGYQRIARTLNELLIPSPSRYLYMKGLAKTEKFANTLWTGITVRQTLLRGVYAGNMEQGRRKSALSEGLRKERALPKEEWTVIRGTHEALIAEETFEAVQRMSEGQKTDYRSKIGKYDYLGTTPNLLRGLVFCADCGCPMVRYKTVTSKGKNRFYTWICHTHAGNPASCSRKNFHDDKLLTILRETVIREIRLAGEMRSAVTRMAKSPEHQERERSLLTAQKEAEAALNRANLLFEGLYANYIDQLLTEQEYAEMKKHYRVEIEKAEEQLASIRQQLENAHSATEGNIWIENFNRFHDTDVLTDEMAHALIERVEIEDGNVVHITLRYRDEYRELMRALSAEESA